MLRSDRTLTEKMFLAGVVPVLCCTVRELRAEQRCVCVCVVFSVYFFGVECFVGVSGDGLVLVDDLAIWLAMFVSF